MTSSDRTRSPGRSRESAPMLHVCASEGCTTIVFGQGTCVEHDPKRVTLVEELLAEAIARSDRREASGAAIEPP